MSYTKYHDAWEDLPSEETPITAASLDHIEQGIYDAADAADTAQTDVDTLEETVGDIQTSVSTLTSTVSGIQTDVDTLEESVSDLEDEVADITDIRTTVTGNPITITATAMQNLAECEVEIVAEQDGTPSPDSPVEITGMSEVTVRRCGKNWFDVSETPSAIERDASVSDGTVTLPNEYSTVRWNLTNLVPGTYTASCNVATNPSSDNAIIQIVNLDGTSVNSRQITTSTGTIQVTFTVTDQTQMRINVYKQTAYATVTIDSIQIELGSTATDYEAYNGTDYTFTLGSTCYGGSLNTKTGVLTVTHAIVDLGTLSWSRTTTVNDNYRYFTTGLGSLIDLPTSMSVVADMLCTSYEAVTGEEPYNEVEGVGLHTNGNVIIYDASLSGYSVADFKTAMSGIYLCYPLATPTTTTLTSQEIALISGENNLSTDADSITAVYQSAPDIYLAIGDSLETGYLTDSTTTTGWGELLPQYFKEKSVFCSGVNGSAFCSSDSSRSTTVTSFQEQLEAMVDDMTDTEKGLVKKVIVGGGFNDIEFVSDEDTIISYITEFCDYVRVNLPKAEILVLITGWATDYSRRIAMGEIKRIYKEACAQNGAAFIDVSFASHKYDHFYSDGVHLLEDGQIALAETMANAIRTGHGAVFYPLTTMAITANGTWCTSAGSCAMSISDDNVTLHLYGQDLFFVDSASFDVNTWCSIGTLPENTFIWGADSSGNNMSFMVNGWICSDGSYYDFMGWMTIVDKLVYIKHTMVAADNTGLRSFSNVTELSIYPTTVSFPLSES